LQQGAPADIFASANPQVIDCLATEHLIGTPQLFAANQLVLLVDKRQRQLKKLADLTLPKLLLVVGNQHVPVGRYTRQLWSNLAADPDYGAELVSNIQRNIISEETSVKAIVTKLLLGEVDAGIVYRSELSEALLAQTVVIELPQQHNPVASYPLAMTRQSKQPDNAQRFINLLLSAEGQQLLADYRFLPVPQGTAAHD
jgi:molybdate transport system substrate-binding protein